MKQAVYATESGQGIDGACAVASRDEGRIEREFKRVEVEMLADEAECRQAGVTQHARHHLSSRERTGSPGNLGELKDAAAPARSTAGHVKCVCMQASVGRRQTLLLAGIACPFPPDLEIS